MELTARATAIILLTTTGALAQQAQAPLQGFERLIKPRDTTYNLTITFERTSRPSPSGTFEPAAMFITANTAGSKAENIANTRMETIQFPADTATATWRAVMPAKGTLNIRFVHLPENGRQHFLEFNTVVDDQTKPLKITVLQKTDGSYVLKVPCPNPGPGNCP